jgi:endonuclease YncB( thermonuclease family)
VTIKYLFISILTILSISVKTFTAKVIAITDGDTIVVLTSENKQVKIRLEGIDCPELKQDFGKRAKQATSDLCFGKEVKIVQTGKDRYGRTLAYVYTGDKCVNHELLKSGMAWHFKKYNNDARLIVFESMARKSKVGIWSVKGQIPPWEFRKKK